jgi:hypothetical protein
MLAASQPIVSLVTGWRWLCAFVPKRAMLVLCESGRIRKGGGPSRKLLKPRASPPGNSSRWRSRNEPALEGSCRRWATREDTRAVGVPREAGANTDALGPAAPPAAPRRAENPQGA